MARLVHAPDSPFAEVLGLADAFASRQAPVLILGESGTGKEQLARFLHRRGPRPDGPFVAVNCAAIAPGLAESELFGHCRGAFTHAVRDRPGCLRRAHGGTLLLDEIGDMPPVLQARLLRVLQESKVRPVGGDEEFSVNFRLLCATHRDLAAEVRAGRFRADLYHRLRVLELRIPPLRDRPCDILPLLRAFLLEFAGEERAREALSSLPPGILRHAFPGNVRELRNLAERYVALRAAGLGWDKAFSPDAEAPVAGCSSRGNGYPFPRNSRLRAEEVVSALEACGHHRGRAAKMLGVSRRAVQYHVARLRSASSSVNPAN